MEAVRGDTEQVGDEQPQRVRVLVRGVVGEVAGVGIVVDEAGAAFERRVALAVLGEPPAVRARRRGELPVRIAVGPVPLEHEVVPDLVEHGGRAVVECGVHVGERGQRFVRDVDELARVLGERTVAATTIATGSPTKRTRSVASGPNAGVCNPAGPAPRITPTTPSRSAAVSTRSTPGSARAAWRRPRRRARARTGCARTRRAGVRGVEIVDELPTAAEQAGVLDPGDAGSDEAAHAPAGSLCTAVPHVLADRPPSRPAPCSRASRGPARVGPGGGPPTSRRHRPRCRRGATASPIPPDPPTTIADIELTSRPSWYRYRDGGTVDEHTRGATCTASLQAHDPPGRRRASRVSKTLACCAVVGTSSTTSNHPGSATPRSCAARSHMHASTRSTPLPRARCLASTSCSPPPISTTSSASCEARDLRACTRPRSDRWRATGFGSSATRWRSSSPRAAPSPRTRAS